MSGLARAMDRFLGRGRSAVTIPPLDGALRPNHALDEIDDRTPVAEPDDLLATANGIFVSSGSDVLRLDGGLAIKAFSESSIVTCLAGISDGSIAVGLETGEIRVRNQAGRATRVSTPGDLGAPTAMASVASSLFVAFASRRHVPRSWRRDLLEGISSGSVWRIDLQSGSRTLLADELAYPSGLVVDGQSLVVSEAWRHRLIRLATDHTGPAEEVLGDLPGYPGRLTPKVGGYWLACFAPRSQLVEFVIHEAAFRHRMLAEVEEAFWIAPALRSGQTFYEPLQGGAVKQLGLLKPWAPSFSAGLVIELDQLFQPLSSLHSRAGGTTHGVTSVLESADTLYVAAKGNDVVLTKPSAGSPR